MATTTNRTPVNRTGRSADKRPRKDQSERPQPTTTGTTNRSRMTVEEQIQLCYRQRHEQLMDEIPPYMRGVEWVELTGRMAGQIVVKVPVRDPNDRIPLRSLESYLAACEDQLGTVKGTGSTYEPFKIGSRAFVCSGGANGNGQTYVAFHTNRTVATE